MSSIKFYQMANNRQVNSIKQGSIHKPNIDFYVYDNFVVKKEQGHLFISLSFSIGFDGAWGVIGVHFTPGFVSNEARHNSLSCCLFIHDGEEFVYFCQKVFLYALQCRQEVASNFLLEDFDLKGHVNSFFKVA